jgi:hypothetical protein
MMTSVQFTILIKNIFKIFKKFSIEKLNKFLKLISSWVIKTESTAPEINTDAKMNKTNTRIIK